MENDAHSEWRGRLFAALQDRQISMRAASLGAKLGPGAVNSWFKEDKDPSMPNLLAVCDFAKISPAFVLFGLNISAETATVIRLLEENPERREGILRLLQAK